MYANLHTFIFAFILIFLTTCKRPKNDRKMTEKMTEKRERPKTASPFPSVILKTKTFHQHKGKPHQLSPIKKNTQHLSSSQTSDNITPNNPECSFEKPFY